MTARRKRSTPDPDLLEKVRAYIREHDMFRSGETILVAVSGGPDSVCLLDLLFRLRDALRISLHVAHLNHRLRGRASDADARFVERTAARMDLPCVSASCDVEALSREERRSIEDAARQARLRFLEETRRRVGASRVALGHTRSDQAETVLLRLLRGSGRPGLSAMRPVRDGVWVRPLLDVGREEIERYAALRGLRFRRDATNRDPRFTRNRIRRNLIPCLRKDYNPDIEEVLARTASILSAEEAWLDEAARKAFFRARRPSAAGKIVLDVPCFLGYHLALQRRILRHALEETGCGGDGLAFGVITRILSMVHGPGGTLRISPGVCVRCASDVLILARPTPPFEIPVRIPGRTEIPALGMVLRIRIHTASEVGNRLRAATPDEAFLDVRLLTGGATVRNIRPGDRLRPLGMTGTKAVRDLLADEKVPGLLRDGVPILTDGSSILWVARHRISQAARVTSATRQVAHVRILIPRPRVPGHETDRSSEPSRTRNEARDSRPA